MIRMRGYRGAPSSFEEEDDDLQPRQGRIRIRNGRGFDDDEYREFLRDELRELSRFGDEDDLEEEYELSFSGARRPRSRREPRAYSRARSLRRGTRMPRSIMSNPVGDKLQIKAKKGLPYVVVDARGTAQSHHRTRSAAKTAADKKRAKYPRRKFSVFNVPWAKSKAAKKTSAKRKKSTAKAAAMPKSLAGKVQIQAKRGFPYVVMGASGVVISHHQTRSAAKKKLDKVRADHPRRKFKMYSVPWAKTKAAAKAKTTTAKAPSGKLAWEKIITSAAYPWLVVNLATKKKVETASKYKKDANRKMKNAEEKWPKLKFGVRKATKTGYKALVGDVAPAKKTTKKKKTGPLSVDGVTASKTHPWVVYDLKSKSKVGTASKTKGDANKKKKQYAEKWPAMKLVVLKATVTGTKVSAATKPKTKAKERPGAIALKGMTRWAPWAIADAKNNWIVGARTKAAADKKLVGQQKKHPSKKLRVVPAKKAA